MRKGREAAEMKPHSSMLSGRESLIRLIGKRRRILSSHHSLLLPHRNPQHQTCSSSASPPPSSSSSLVEINTNTDAGPSHSHSLEKDKPADVGAEQEGKAGNGSEERFIADWVACPVCGNTVRGSDVHSHLDSCLARGNKRKLTQCTLVQLGFCSRAYDKTYLNEANNSQNDVSDRGLDDENETNTDPMSPEFCSPGNHEINQYATDSLFSAINVETHAEVSVDNMTMESTVSGETMDLISAPLSPPRMKITMLDRNGAGNAISGTKIETYVVGHRFHDEAELFQGTSISLLRDLENSKDQYAIKVLCTDSECSKTLGYLPRELTLYLSPLIDSYHLNFKGSVTSLPKHPTDVIPIQLVCQRMEPDKRMECGDNHLFESLWENVLRIVEYAKRFPPSMTKYQRNFLLMIQEVLNHHTHLFTDDEKLFLGLFDSLRDDSQKIFIRLFTRKGPWFRMSNVSYPEIMDSHKAIDELLLAKYICSFLSMGEPCKKDVKEVLDVLTVVELREISNFLLSKKGISCTRKQELINWLFSAYEDGTCSSLPSVILQRAGTCVKISSSVELLLWRVQRLFFLNGEQDLSSFLLVDLGLVRYPSYTCRVSRPIFQCRNDLLTYEEAIEVAQLMDQSLDENDLEMVMRCIDTSDARLSASTDATHSGHDSTPTFLSRFSALWVYSKVVNLGVSFLEREQRYEEAVRLLKGLLRRITSDSRRGYWTLRLSVDLEHIGYLSESLLVAEEGIQDPWVRAGSKMALQRRILRLGKPPRRWKTPSFALSVKRKIKEVRVGGRPLNCETGTKNRYYGFDGDQCGVEQLALQYYAGDGGGWKGVHSESGIWMTIFGVLMWNVIFADIPDVFQTRFQTAPLDLATDNFYVTRKDLIESHLQKIYEGMAEEILIASWESHVGTGCRGVNWDRHDLTDLRAAVSCIGGRCLTSLCRHLAQDYRSWCSGMPDLFLWRFHGGDQDGGEAKLVEVKGPRDRLSEQQRAWLLLLMDCGFNVEVCRVCQAIEEL